MSLGNYFNSYVSGNYTRDTWRPPSNPSWLTSGTWVDGNITSSGVQDWYAISVNAGTTYYLWWNDSYEGDYSKTLDVLVSAYDSDGTSIISRGDSAWDSPESFTASSDGTVYIKVYPYSSGGTGTYAIVYSTSSTRPGN